MRHGCGEDRAAEQRKGARYRGSKIEREKELKRIRERKKERRAIRGKLWKKNRGNSRVQKSLATNLYRKELQLIYTNTLDDYKLNK